MPTIIDAVYEDGILRPLHALKLANKQHVTLTIDEMPIVDQIDFTLSPDQWDAFSAALDAPAKKIPALHNLLKTPGIFDGRRISAE